MLDKTTGGVTTRIHYYALDFIGTPQQRTRFSSRKYYTSFRPSINVASPLLILIFSKCDFPFRFREKKSLTYSSIPILLNNGGFWGLNVLVTGPNSASNLGLKNVAIEILSLSEFTVTLCSMLV